MTHVRESKKARARSQGESITLSRSEYEALIRAAENALDIAAVRAAEKEDDYLPAALVRRLVGGESPIRIYREHRGLTQRSLAARADVGSSFLSQVERGAKSPSVAVLRRLADALDVAMDDLV